MAPFGLGISISHLQQQQQQLRTATTTARWARTSLKVLFCETFVFVPNLWVRASHENLSRLTFGMGELMSYARLFYARFLHPLYLLACENAALFVPSFRLAGEKAAVTSAVKHTVRRSGHSLFQPLHPPVWYLWLEPLIQGWIYCRTLNTMTLRIWEFQEASRRGRNARRKIKGKRRGNTKKGKGPKPGSAPSLTPFCGASPRPFVHPVGGASPKICQREVYSSYSV